MVNITNKSSTLRIAVASAILKVSAQETIMAIENKKIPKGDVFEFSRAAGLLAIKKTSDVIPDCHPLPIEYAAISHAIEGLDIKITVEVHTIYKTGVEVEAMHGAAITALTIYDMLKPVDKGIEISSVKLEEKKGGKTDFNGQSTDELKCAVIVCSDSVSKGISQDIAGKEVKAKLQRANLSVSSYGVIPDELEQIQAKARQLSEEDYNLVLFVGGTGLSSRDITPEAINAILDRPVPGIMEAARSYGQQRTPYAMLSRGVAGFLKNTLIITLPGSTRGATETMDAIFPSVLHIFQVAKGMRHD